MEHFDVIIVGAGPAGLRCAETLGNSKYKVLVLEQNKEIGPKVCAGGLTKRDIELLNLPKTLLDFQSNEVILHVNNHKFEIKDKENSIFTIERRNLGQWQLKKLKKSKNIEVRTNSRVSKIEKNFVVVNGKKIAYDFLVGADGSYSKVRKYLGVESKKVGIAIQYRVPMKHNKLEIFFDSKLFSAWYAWIFPHKKYTTVGCMSDPKVLPSKELTRNFEIWLEKNKIDVSNAKYEAFMLNYDYQGYRFGNIFLTGDAAGLVSGFTGEGIYSALVSGEEVAKMILDKNYQSKRIEEIIRIKRTHEKIMNLLIKLGGLRTFAFYTGVLLTKMPYFKGILKAIIEEESEK